MNKRTKDWIVVGVIAAVLLFIGGFVGAKIGNDSRDVPNLRPIVFADVLDEEIDSISTREVLIHKYLVAADLLEYNNELYSDSIHVSEFNEKPINGYWFKTKGVYYYNPTVGITPETQYLHRIFTLEGFADFLVNKYGNIPQEAEQ